jgi:hypothetical protein
MSDVAGRKLDRSIIKLAFCPECGRNVSPKVVDAAYVMVKGAPDAYDYDHTARQYNLTCEEGHFIASLGVVRPANMVGVTP